MQKFQQLIIKQNQIVLNNVNQKLILIFQFLITLIWNYIALQILAEESGETLRFQVIYYFSLPTLSLFFEIQQFIIQAITLIFSLSYLIAVLFAGEMKSSVQLVKFFWLVYPNAVQLVIIHNSAYAIFLDNANFILAILNIILAVFISQLVSLYSFHQNNSQILLRSYIERSTIPFAYSMLAFIAGIAFKSNFLAYVYLGAQLGFDLYFGPLYYIIPHMQFIKLVTTKITVLLSMLRAPVVGFSIFYGGNEIFYFAFFFIPIMIKLHLILWDQRFIALIYSRNMFFQFVCIDKYRENNPMAETYLAYFFEIITYKAPFNRILMLSLFCNHVNLCKNLKCFCQNKQFYENVQVTSNLAIDLIPIKQQINYVIGEGEITLCYKQLILLFFTNFIKNSRFTPIQETLILELSLFEVDSFKQRLFQSKIRFQRLTINYPKYHPLFIQRIATKKLITEQLQQFIGNQQTLLLDVANALKYFELFDDINLNMYQITKEKLVILQIINSNYQNSQPFLLNQEVVKYLKNCNNLELQIKELVTMNGKAEEVRDLQNDFYSLIKIDYNRHNIYKKTLMPFININPTAYVMCQHDTQLKIIEYSSNFIPMINLSAQVKGLEIETIVPAPLQNYHRVAVASMIETGKTKLVNQGQYQLIVKSEKYILEVDALLRFDYRDQNALKFIGFMQQRDKDSMLILASEQGKVDSYSRSTGTLLHMNQIDLSLLNYFYLSPSLVSLKDSFEFDGFIMLPRKNSKRDMLSHYRHYISYPDECFVFLVNAEHKTTTYSAAKIHCLKINSYYQLKESDFKVIALDLMIRQIMILKKINKSQYALQPETVRKIETFRKTLRIVAAHQTQSLEEEDQYDLEQGDDSERNIQQKQSIKYIMPDVLPSLDSVRTQQEKLLVTMDQYKDTSYPILGKEFEQHQKLETIDFGSKSEQETICKQIRNTHKMIEIELEASEDQNIEEQLQIIQKCVKQQRTRAELIEMKNQRKNGNIKASTWHGSGQLQQQKQLIVAMVNAFQSTEFNLLIYLKSVSPLLMAINIAFIIGFILNSIVELEGIQMDSNNKTYPLILLSDLNLVLIGLQLGDWDESSFDVAQSFITTGGDQYHNMSVYVNDIEMDYHLFLQELDEETITLVENGVEIIYKSKYFFKNYMIFKLRTIEESTIDLWGSESQFLFTNYPLIATRLWDLKNKTTYDVVQRMDELTQKSNLLLIFSILSNFFAACFYAWLILKIYQWRNKLYSTLFLFNNIQSLIISLAQKIDQDYNEIKTTNGKNEEQNKNLQQFQRVIGLIILLTLLILSLGFYIPLFLYIDSINTETLNVNQLLTDVAMMQLKESITLNWYFVNSTNYQYGVELIKNTSIITQVIQESAESEQLVLYVLPFDSSYNYFPQIQQYSTTPLCNCSLLNGQLQNGYNGFYQYVIQHLTDSNQLIDIMQAYQIVVDYQISTKSIYDDLMQVRLANTVYNMKLILILGVISIAILQSILLTCVYYHQQDIVWTAKSILHLFPPQLLATNKYTLQLLLQYGIK